MNPILFKSDEEDFTSNGIGRLHDISCEVTEEKNGEYELEMVLPITDRHYADMEEEMFIYAMHDDTKKCQPFRIYKITRPINGKATIYARHRTYDLSGTTVMPMTAQSCAGALQGMKSHAADGCDFEFWTDKDTTGAFEIEVPTKLRAMLGGVTGSILDVYGGEYEWDNKTVKLHSARGTDTNITIKYGKNLTDVKKTTDVSSVWTGVVPYWSGQVDGQQVLVTLPEKVLYTSAADQYTHNKTIPLDLSGDFQSQPTEKQLRDAAQVYIKANALASIPATIDVNFVQLWQTEEYKDIAPLQRLRLCDTLTVEYKELGVSNKAKIVKTVYDVNKERYSSMTIGNVRTNIVDGIKSVTDPVTRQAVTKTAMQLAIDKATKLITGGTGGYVVTNMDENGKPNELLVMDAPDINKAVNVLRINEAGIGFSQNGYNGPYRSAWTLDGSFVADFITTGTLTATLIKAGILQDAKGVNFWDMETGEFQLSADVTVGGKTVEEIAEAAASDNADKYTESLTQESIFNILTNKGETQGIYLKEGKLYINGSYIESGTLAADLIKGGKLKLGGSNNQNGILEVYDSSGNVIGTWDNDGISAAGKLKIEADIANGNYKKDYLELGKYVIDAELFNVTYEDTVNAYGLKIYPDNEDTKNCFHILNYVNDTNNYLYSSASYLYNNSGIIIMVGDDKEATKLRVTDESINLNAKNTTTSGNFTCNGTKSRKVATDDYGDRLLYCYEMPSPTFGDTGEGIIGSDGQTYVSLSPIFMQTISTSEYQVFLQRYGQGDVYVSERKQQYFVVKGDPGTKFGYEIKARQLGYEQLRLEKDASRVKIGNAIAYSEEADRYIAALNMGRTAA